MSHVLSAHTYTDGDFEWCCCCGAGIADGGCHSHGDLLVTRVHSPHAARRVES